MTTSPLAATPLAETLRTASLQLMEMHSRARTGHLGGDLSCLPGLLAVTARLRPQDRLVLSKGHSAAALYVSLATVGLLPPEALSTYYEDGTKLPGHPPVNAFDAIPFGTGSLGHGLSLASGLALASRLQGGDATVYCLTSDGEWQEGSTWEALVFAAHQGLRDLVVLVDQNGWQALGRTADIASMGSVADRLAGFPVDVRTLDGNDPDVVAAALDAPRDRLTVLVLETTKGRGVDFLEDTLESHYAVLTPEQLADVAAAGAATGADGTAS